MFVNVPANIYTSYQAENRDKAYIYGAEISTRVNYGSWFPTVDGLSSTFALGYSEGKRNPAIWATNTSISTASRR